MSAFVLYFTASSSVTTGFCKFYYYFQKQVLYEFFSFLDNFSQKNPPFSPQITIFPIHTVVDFQRRKPLQIETSTKHFYCNFI